MYKDGFENLVEEDREEAVILEMEVDFEEYPLDSVTNYDQYTDLKPRKNLLWKYRERDDVATESTLMQIRKTSSYLFTKRTVSQAAKKLSMPVRTAQSWYDRDQENLQDVVQRKQAKSPVGRPPKLVEDHREFLVQLIDKKPSLVLDQNNG